jgi:hypothetical protein
MPASRDDTPISRNVVSGNIISGNNAPVTVGSHVSNLTSNSSMQVARSGPGTADLLALLTALRREVETAQPAVPKQEVVLDTIDDLTADAQAAHGGSQAVEPAVARSRWEKIRSLLVGATQITADLTQIGQGVGQLFGYG